MMDPGSRTGARPPWPVLTALALLLGLWPVSTMQARARSRTPRDTAWTRIYGTVTDARTGKPVPGVAVVIVGMNIGSPTNEDGRYVILAAPTTAREIELRRTCFRTVRVDVSSSLSTDQPLRVDVGLPFQKPESRPGVVVPPWACQEFERR